MRLSGRSLVTSSSAHLRLRHAAEWLCRRLSSERVLVIGATLDGPSELLRNVATGVPASFGWERITLTRLAGLVAAKALRERELSPLSPLGVEAVCARLVHQLGARQELGRFQPVWRQPGLARALARTLQEVRNARARPTQDLGRILDAYEAELLCAKLADRSGRRDRLPDSAKATSLQTGCGSPGTISPPFRPSSAHACPRPRHFASRGDPA